MVASNNDSIDCVKLFLTTNVNIINKTDNVTNNLFIFIYFCALFKYKYMCYVNTNININRKN